MSALVKLWMYKQKAVLRNLYRKPSSAIITTLMILLYGFLFMMVLMQGGGKEMVNLTDMHMAILMSLGFGAMLVISLMLQKRKALFNAEDSFYLFSGPFSRRQVMRYLCAQTLLQAFLFSLFTTFMMICFGMGLPFTIPFLVFSILANMTMYLFFLIFTDYVYILSITNPTYKRISRVLVVVLIAVVAVIFFLSMMQNQFQIKTGLLAFAQNELFYLVPIFGWVKLFLVSYMLQNYVSAFIGMGLLILANGIVFYFFVSYQGDFYEQAMMDAEELSSYMKSIKAGKENATRMNGKIHQATTKFLPGAGAVFSKNFLIMKKTHDFIRPQELVTIVIYFAVSIFTDLGFGMFCYMLVIWLFQMLQTSDLVRELKNYQIYLIPAKPMPKLLYALLPTLIKISLILTIAVVGSGVFYQMSIEQIFQNVIMLLGYALIFVSGTVVSIRIMKSRTNMMIENLMRMLVIVLCALPGIVISIVLVLASGTFRADMMEWMSYVSLLMNFIVSLLLLYACRNMMNGREMDSD